MKTAIFLAMSGLVLAGCASSAMSVRPHGIESGAALCEGGCPVGHYSLPVTYFTVTIKPEKVAEPPAPGTADGATATAARVPVTCEATAAEFQRQVAELVSKRPVRLRLLAQAQDAIEPYLPPSRSDGSSRAEPTPAQRQQLEAVKGPVQTALDEMNTEAEQLRGLSDYYATYCSARVEVEIGTTTRYDGDRFAVYADEDLMTDDHLVLTMTDGGLAGMDLTSTDQSGAAVEAAARGLIGLSNVGARISYAVSGVGFFAVVPAEARQLLTDLFNLEQTLEQPLPTLTPALPPLIQVYAMRDVLDEAVEIWPGYSLSVSCRGRQDHDEPRPIQGLWSARPLPCEAQVRTATQRIASQPFTGLDGQSVEPLGVQRARFAGRTTNYRFTNGYVTSSDLTTHSPVATVLGLPARLSEGLTAGFKDSKAEIDARVELLKSEAELRTAQAAAVTAAASAPSPDPADPAVGP